MKHLLTLLLCINIAFAQCPNGTFVNIIINPDQYPEETSWAIITELEDTIISGGPYVDIVDYSPQVTQLCIPNGEYIFSIADQYGDGVAGSLWGGQDGSYYVVHCGDTIVQPDSADFGYAAFHGFTLEDCAPPPPVFGCMDDNFVEFLPTATVDTGMCFTEKIFGCTDIEAFNYDSIANTDVLVDSCTHTLRLTDLAGNGWAGSYLQVFQGDNFLGIFTLEDGFDTTFTFDLSISEPVGVKFNITQQSDFTAVQCGYSLYSEENVAIEIEGGFVNPIPPFVILYGEPGCGDNCIEKTYGCIDETALNYNDSVNTDDGSCYYIAGCTNPSFIEYNEEADFDDGSCETLIVIGCMDTTAFNYNPEANVELEGSCIEVVLGCMDDDAFNYNINANVEDGSCIPVVFGCIDPLAFNYCDTCNTDNGSCIEVINGCTDSTALNYYALANTDNGSCIYPVYGCNDPSAINYDPFVNVPDSSCEYSAGCAVGDVYTLPNACFEWVIQVDPYCCNDNWDNTCYELYNYCEEGWTGPVDISMYKRTVYIPYPNPTKDYINFNETVDVLVIDNYGRKHKLYLDTKRIKLDKGINYIKVSNDRVNFTTIIIVQ
jgi:hypothetical protein|tara:strand:- start:255 stop:2060 length:1806 start_codon:yes stop_codon:yes gene_type:complete